MNRLKFLMVVMVALIIAGNLNAQSSSRYFSVQSVTDPASKGYGTVSITAEQSPVMLNTILANGEQVKALIIQFSKGGTYKLAPAQSGQILNYVGSSLAMIILPGETATISFLSDSKVAGNRSVRVSGEYLKQN